MLNSLNIFLYLILITTLYLSQIRKLNLRLSNLPRWPGFLLSGGWTKLCLKRTSLFVYAHLVLKTTRKLGAIPAPISLPRHPNMGSKAVFHGVESLPPCEIIAYSPINYAEPLWLIKSKQRAFNPIHGFFFSLSWAACQTQSDSPCKAERRQASATPA